MIKMIISGGQTGADQAGLDAAILNRVKHSGWIPKGRITEAGKLPAKYNLKEMSSTSYPKRTEKNILDFDGTIIFTYGKLTGGSALTLKYAKKHSKPCLTIDLNESSKHLAVNSIKSWIENEAIKIINIAGPRASKSLEIYDAVFNIVNKVLKSCE